MSSLIRKVTVPGSRDTLNSSGCRVPRVVVLRFTIARHFTAVNNLKFHSSYNGGGQSHGMENYVEFLEARVVWMHDKIEASLAMKVLLIIFLPRRVAYTKIHSGVNYLVEPVLQGRLLVVRQ